MTEGYGLARDTSCYEVTTLSSVAEVRVLEPVTQRGQVGDMSRNFPNGVAKPLIKVSGRTLVALRSEPHSAYHAAR